MNINTIARHRRAFSFLPSPSQTVQKETDNYQWVVVYADRITRTETNNETGEEAEREIPFMKGYTVFNVEQIEGLPEHYYVKPAPRGDTVRRIGRAEAFFAATGADIRQGGGTMGLLCGVGRYRASWPA